jgi:hypothetical protein
MPYTVLNPSPVPLPSPFVVKNGVAHSQQNIATGDNSNVVPRICFVEFGIGSLQHQLAASGHCIPRIDREIHDDLLDLPGIGEHRAEILRRSEDDLNILSDQTAQ